MIRTKTTKRKSLVRQAAEKIEQSIKQSAKLPKPSRSKLTPTLKQLAAQALVKDKINYQENKPNLNASIIRLDKKPISIAGMREDELARSHHSRFVPATMFQNLFENRLNQMPRKRENVQLMINAAMENIIECFHSRGQHLCKFIETKDSVCIRKEFNSHRTVLGHQHGRRFIVFGHQYGRRDVM